MQEAKHMEASHVGGFDDFGECDEFGEISSNCEMNPNKFSTWRPDMLADKTILANAKKGGKISSN